MDYKICTKQLGSELRELRKKKGVSIYKAARELHISGNYLSQIERGVKIPSEIVINSLTLYYELDEIDLLMSFG